MRKAKLWIALTCWMFAATTLASAGTRKAGLWELTTTTTWQKSPSIPGAEGDALRGGTRTREVCLTQEMIDLYGALLPQSRGQCTLANKVVKSGSITADWVCTGMMSGKGALQSTWTDTEHETGKVHFVGTFQVGTELQPVEWTTESSSVFKNASCGGVKPLPLPTSRR
jgi:hypothetical protein